MAEKRIKLTDEHFAAFKAEAERWLDWFNLRNWNVYYERIPEGEDALADCDNNYYNRVGSIRLAKSFRHISDIELMKVVCKAAFHEVCELMLCELRAMSRYHGKETDEAVHEVIRRLEHAVFRPDWERRHQMKGHAFEQIVLDEFAEQQKQRGELTDD